MQTSTIVLQGGLNLVTPLVAMQPGTVVAAVNYEPDAAGYRRIWGFERFDGRPSPSDALTIEGGAYAVFEEEVFDEGVYGSYESAAIAIETARRAAITAVPGTGTVRGVHVHDGAVWAWRDTTSGTGAMYKSSATGWALQSPDSHEITFSAGSAAFVEGETLTGGTSAATATIERVVLRSGTWGGGDAAGYLIVSGITGTFQIETGTSASGSATISNSTRVTLAPGGRYDCLSHNFYGPTKNPRMYFANGAGTAFEWDGSTLAPIRSSNDAGVLESKSYLKTRAGDYVLTRDGGRILLRGDYDRPTHIAEFRNHLFLSFRSGGIINSGVGEPLDYRTAAGALDYAFGSDVTSLLPPTSTALVVFGENHIGYIAGNDSSDFALDALSSNAGAIEWTPQLVGGSPVYLDEGGIRNLSTTQAFGNWRIGTITQLVEPLFEAKKAAGVNAVGSLVMRGKDQYWLFFDDHTGVVVYFGRERPEILPFKLPVQVSCCAAGILDEAEGERYFVGCDNGYVYELDAGTSFDGASVAAFLRMAWSTMGSPLQNKRFHKVTVQGQFPDACTVGIDFDNDWRIPWDGRGAQQNISVAAGQTPATIDYFANIDWTHAVEGHVEAYLTGFGTGCVVSVITDHTYEDRHTLATSTMHFMPRGKRR